MSDPIQVNSFSSLEELETAISTFSARFSEVLEDAEREIERKRQLIDDAIEDRRRRVGYWQQEYDSADPDEDDIGAISYRLEEAENDLKEARRWQRRIEESYSSYSKQASRSTFLCTEDTRKAHAVLREKIKALYEYAALNPELSEASAMYAASGPGVLDGVLGAAELVAESGVGTIEPSADALSSFILPRGFQWISLDRIDPADLKELPNDDEFRKMPKQDMTMGMELFRTRILPEIQRNPNAVGSDYFWQVDQREGRTGANSLRNIYDAYFGGERIRVESAGQSGYYRLDHGRHRVKLATELGWIAVPVSLR